MENLALLKCKNCGAELDEREAVNGVIECKYCHTPWPVPKKETTSEALRYIHSGNSSLDVCKFDDAFTYFQKASELDKQEPEAYFGMALASFCVQYLKDEVNDCLQPICHEISDKMFTDDKNYRKALELATMEQKRIYRRRGQEIDEIRDEFFALKKSGLDFDCFICVKVTEEDSHRRTQDYDRANDIYYHLKDCGYKPFFSEREMKGRTGAAYEALILYALYTSECMLIVCSNDEYLQTKWVKNEYTRFMSMLANHEKDRDAITFVFNGVPIERLPNGKKIQGIDYTKPDAYTRLTDFVNKHTPEAAQKREEEKLRKQREEEARNRLIEEQAKQLEEQKRLIEEQNKRFGEMMNNFSSSNISSASSSTKVDHKGKESESQKQIDEKYQKGLALYKNKDYTRALPYFIDAANYGHAYAQSYLGDCYFYGRGVTQNYAKAVEWYTKAANKGQASAQCNLGWCYDNGRGVTQNYAKAVEWYTKAADQGHAMGQNNLGWSYESGHGVAQNYAKAVEWYTKAADQGHAMGQNNLGKCYYYGRGVTQNYAKAVEWFTKAVNQGYALGQNNLGICYEYGEGVTQNYAKAVEWYTKAANQGNALAQYNLGHCYKKGSGVEKNLNVARQWFEKAAKQGNENAKKELEKENKERQNITDFEIVDGTLTKYKGKNSSVTIPDSVKIIGRYAFEGCISLTSVTIPYSVTYIDAYAFSKCTSLRNITISNRVTRIGRYAFERCKSLICVTIPNGVNYIDNSAFEGCKSLTSVIIPDSIEIIGSYAFAFCESLTSVTIPNSVTGIGSNAFFGCTNLASVTIPERFKGVFNMLIKDIFSKSYKNITFTFT